MPTLALSMIVRDAESMLGACLESVRGAVDEIVIGDTGSTDGTPEVARQHGARLVSIPWENDFAQARNRALEEIRADWVLVLDADEQLDPGARRVLPSLLDRRAVVGYQVTIRNYVLNLSDRLWDQPARVNDSGFEPARNFPAYVEHQNVRLFRRQPEIYFVGRVHETVGHRIAETGGKLGQTAFVIHHFGLAADGETRARKNHLYRELGRLKVREAPQNAQAHFELGLVEFDCFHNDVAALECFNRACQLDPRLGVAWFFAGLALLRLGRAGKALEAFKQAESYGHRTALVRETQGDAYYNLGQFEAARRAYRCALECAGKSVVLESKLGLAEVRVGRTEAGLRHLRQAIECEPQTGELYDRLMVAGVWLGRLDIAATAAECRLGVSAPHPDAYLRAASIRAQQHEWRRAAEILRSGLRKFPEAEKLRQGLAEVERQEALTEQPALATPEGGGQ